MKKGPNKMIFNIKNEKVEWLLNNNLLYSGDYPEEYSCIRIGFLGNDKVAISDIKVIELD